MLHANREGALWAKDLVQLEAFASTADRALRLNQAQMHEAAGRSFLVVPLNDGSGPPKLVIALENRTAWELPAILDALYENTRHFSQVVHLIPGLVLTARPDGTFDYASRRWHNVVGTPPDAIDFSDAWRHGVSGGEPFSFETQLETTGGERWHIVRAEPWYEETKLKKWIVLVTDIDESVNVRTALAEVRRRESALARIGAVLLETDGPPAELMRAAFDVAHGVIGGIWIAFYNLGKHRDVITYPADGRFFARIFEQLSLDAPETLMQQWNGDDPRPVMHAPLDLELTSGNSIAVVGAPGAPAYTQSEVDFLRQVSVRVSHALRRFAEYDRQFTAAAILQEALLPKTLPDPFGISFDVTYRAAEDLGRVGGDWYDAFELQDGRVAFSIGDVSGHGLEAAIVMGHARELIRLFAMQGEFPEGVLRLLGDAIFASSQRLMTAFVGILDPLTLTMDYASAGHPAPFVVARDGTLESLENGGVAIGAIAHPAYARNRCTLAADSAVVLYTDGLTEFERDASSGERALRNVLSEWGRSGFVAAADELAELTIKSAEPIDDIAVLVVRTKIVTALHANVRGTIENAQRARKTVNRALSGSPFGARTADFVLAMSEAINNALEHGCASEEDLVWFTIDWDRGGVRGSVVSSGPWRIGVPNDERGRGLRVIRGLTDRMDIDTDHKSTIVRIAMDNASWRARASR